MAFHAETRRTRRKNKRRKFHAKAQSSQSFQKIFLECFLGELSASHEKVGLSTTNLIVFHLRKVLFFLSRPTIPPARTTTRPAPIRTVCGPAVRCTLGFLVVLGAAFFAAVSSLDPGAKPQSPKLGVLQCQSSDLPPFRGRLRGDGFFGLVAQRLVYFPRHPQPMQQHRQFPRHRHHRPLLRVLAAALAQL